MDAHHHSDHDSPSWEWPWHRLARIEADLDHLGRMVQAGFRRMEWIIMAASQADIDAITNKLSDLKAALQADDANIQQELIRLQGQGVDVTALQNALGDLSAQVDATTALVPAAAPADNSGDVTPPADETGGNVTPADSGNGGDVPPAA